MKPPSRLRIPGGARPWEALLALAVVSTLGMASAVAVQPEAARTLVHGVLTATAPAPQRGLSALPAAAPAPVASPAAVSVRPLNRLYEADLLITSTRPIDSRARRLVAQFAGVRHTLRLATGGVALGRTLTHAIAGDPGQLRAWTPGPTARSDALWRTVAAGTVAASFDAGKNLRLPLGGQVGLRDLHGTAPVSVTLGALASTGFPGIDLAMAPALGHTLGLTPDAALVVSAPRADLPTLRDQLRRALGPTVQVVLLRETRYVVVRDAGSFLNRSQLATVLRAAESRIGAPYVWGATGPVAFDCSGLVGYAFAAAGIALPRTSEQLWFAGPHVASRDARPGDLLFWANDPAAPQDIDHVAIYLGGGLMISAPHAGAQVHVIPVISQNFRGVVRVNPDAAARVGGPMWSLNGVS